jgi:hypothetical protein
MDGVGDGDLGANLGRGRRRKGHYVRPGYERINTGEMKREHSPQSRKLEL